MVKEREDPGATGEGTTRLEVFFLGLTELFRLSAMAAFERVAPATAQRQRRMWVVGAGACMALLAMVAFAPPCTLAHVFVTQLARS